jgi:elongation factor G
VLDSAIVVLDGVAGVQSQTYTVDRQMQRYRVPRLVFINKLDRVGADPFRVIDALKENLGLNLILLQYPLGMEDKFEGVVDLIEMTANYFEGENGEHRVSKNIPEYLQAKVQAARGQLLDRISIHSEEMMARLLDSVWKFPSKRSGIPSAS